MLLLIKNHKSSLSKNELAWRVGVNHNSIQSWRTIYLSKGLEGLLKHKRGGKRWEVITPIIHQAIEERLRSAHNAFTSFTELREWIAVNYLSGIKYVTVNAYVKKHFGAKLKVAIKSHIKNIAFQTLTELSLKIIHHHLTTNQIKSITS